MRGKGNNYDTGYYPGGKISRQGFDPDIVRREMQVIRASWAVQRCGSRGASPSG